MARGKADRALTVGKKLEIIEEADRTGLIAATAQKYGVKTGQIRDWKKNIDRLRATDPSRLVCASTIQRGHLVFNETYAQYWVGYNKFCSNNTNYDDLKNALRVTHKDVLREGVNGFNFPAMVDPSATHELVSPDNNGFYTTEEVKNLYVKDMTTLRDQLREFFGQKPFPTKYMYFVTKLDFVKPDPNENTEEDEDGNRRQTDKVAGVEDVISFYVAICGNGQAASCAQFARTKLNDPNDALEFFSVTWKKFYEEEAKYSDKFAFLLDYSIEEFRAPEFLEGLKQLEGYNKYWTTLYTVRNPLRLSRFEDTLSTFVLEEWRSILQMKKSSQPNDYRKCVAFWFYSAWEFFAGDNARVAFRSCNIYLEDKAAWAWTLAKTRCE
ncbi:putative oxidoreductase C2F3.05c [Phytophthora nicotianae]|uniref:Oxidoreductase C2F3.05c n=1 Tax=Phytophthora nicotianae TaxID=4792 RepID=A0A0W8DGQ3_PHYNI|nr:putative oxidoreductase C2F3.05c [Phytophthora nicotianae]